MSKLIGMLLNDKQVYVGPFLRGKKGILLGFGFVNFENADAASKAVESLKGNTFDDKQWVVDRAQKKSEREMELKVPYEQSLKEIADKFQSYNLYVKNLDEEKLKELFTPYGTVMQNSNGISRGSGFVAFSTQKQPKM
ncbi:unnamed protein product [Arabidopsis thaliana]|uniref:RRM domain-containing protein n=1 Tax=Arabidopsis thaliana TaxID=3702 RepID=A0A5S9WY83_ARATH|nr:unnamed protein product [Arabidopsis thaliana]